MSRILQAIIKATLKSPLLFDLFESLIGGTHRMLPDYLKNYVKPFKNARVLDLGCGTGRILHHMQGIEYVGLDGSREYIELARKRFGRRAHFDLSQISAVRGSAYKNYDIVMANGVLHHLDQIAAKQLVELAASALKPGGRFVTFDPFKDRDIPLIQKAIVSLDRGGYIRTRREYRHLVSRKFETVMLYTRHDLLRFPFPLLITVCIAE